MDIFKEWETFYKERYKDWDGKVQLEGSGERLRRLTDELCWPMAEINEEVEKNFKSVFQDPFDEILVGGPTSIWTFCPHHLLPCFFRVWIGYIPSGSVLGLSKFTRISIALARRPIMQEQYTRELADSFETHLRPEGLGIHIVGNHGCMGCRGVNQKIDIKTTVLRGSFKHDPVVREEFYRNIKE